MNIPEPDLHMNMSRIRIRHTRLVTTVLAVSLRPLGDHGTSCFCTVFGDEFGVSPLARTMLTPRSSLY
jgi:hypothetical protein